MLVLGGRDEEKRQTSEICMREMVTTEGSATPACAGGETPHFLPVLGLRKC